MEYDAVSGILGLEATYESHFDYLAYEVPKESIDTLIRFEQDIKNHQKKTLDSIFSMSKILYNARDLLANNKNGTFGAWHEALGLNREAVSILLKRYSIYLQVKDKTVMELPVRAVKVITKVESRFSPDQIKEIIKSGKPLSTLKDIVRQSDNKIVEEAEIIHEPITAETISKDFLDIKKLLGRAEKKLSAQATNIQKEKLMRIKEILRDI